MQTYSSFFVPRPSPNSKIRLICFNYAGGNFSSFLPWLKSLPGSVELTLVQLPGRGARIAEPAHTSMDEMVLELFVDLGTLDTKDYIFFGHSLGAMVAYELLLKLFENDRQLPIHFIASGNSAPFIEKISEPISSRPKEQVLNKLKELDGTPEVLMKNSEIMELALPALRSDFKISETYINRSKQKLPTTISVFAGTEDGVTTPDLEAWFSLFQHNTGLHWFEGGHFFINSDRKKVIDKIVEISRHTALNEKVTVI